MFISEWRDGFVVENGGARDRNAAESRRRWFRVEVRARRSLLDVEPHRHSIGQSKSRRELISGWPGKCLTNIALLGKASFLARRKSGKVRRLLLGPRSWICVGGVRLRAFGVGRCCGRGRLAHGRVDTPIPDLRSHAPRMEGSTHVDAVFEDDC